MPAAAARMTAKQLVETTPEWVARLPRTLSDKVEEGVNLSKEAIKRARHTAEDLLDDATYNLKHHPWKSAGVVLGLGFGIGIGAGILIGRAFAPRRRFRWRK